MRYSAFAALTAAALTLTGCAGTSDAEPTAAEGSATTATTESGTASPSAPAESTSAAPTSGLAMEGPQAPTDEQYAQMLAENSAEQNETYPDATALLQDILDLGVECEDPEQHLRGGGNYGIECGGFEDIEIRVYDEPSKASDYYLTITELQETTNIVYASNWYIETPDGITAQMLHNQLGGDLYYGKQ